MESAEGRREEGRTGRLEGEQTVPDGIADSVPDRIAAPAREEVAAFARDRLALFERYGAAMESRRVADRHGRETCVLDSGGGGRPLLMIHGGGAEASIWAPIAGRFTDRHRVLVPDRPGCGLSYEVAYGGFDYRAAAAEWVSDLVRGLGLESVDILANSMGGFFALVYALSGADRIRRLALAGATAGLDRWLPYPVRLLGVKGVNRVLFALQDDTDVDGTRDVFDELLVADAGVLDDEFLQIAARAMMLPGALVGWRTLLEECATLFGFRTRYLIREEVASLAVPTLMVWGEDDAFAPPDSGARLARRMPNATLVRIDGAGHLPWLDAPDAVVGPVREFLAGNGAARGD